MRHVIGVALSVTIATVLVAGCSSHRSKGQIPISRQPQQSHVATAQPSWQPIFFRQIDELARIGNLPDLRSSVLAKDDLEARLWIESGPFGMDGIVVTRRSGVWSAVYLHGFSKEPNFKKYAEPMRTPRSGWDATWQKLVDAGLLSIPDATQVGCNVGGLDGTVFVFEIYANNTYRNYMYDNPAFADCAEARQVLKMISIIDGEFGLSWPATR